MMSALSNQITPSQELVNHAQDPLSRIIHYANKCSLALKSNEPEKILKHSIKCETAINELRQVMAQNPPTIPLKVSKSIHTLMLAVIIIVVALATSVFVILPFAAAGGMALYLTISEIIKGRKP